MNINASVANNQTEKRTEPGRVHAKIEVFHFTGDDVRLQIFDQFGTHEMRIHKDAARFVVEAVAAANRALVDSTNKI